MDKQPLVIEQRIRYKLRRSLFSNQNEADK